MPKISAFLFILLIGLFLVQPLKVEAETDYSEIDPTGNFKYVNQGSSIFIQKYIGDSPVVVVPDTIAGLPVTAMNGFSSDYTFITSVTLPSTLNTIGYGFFSGCSSLEEVIIPNSFTTVNEYSFTNCTSLETLEFPSSVTSIKKEIIRGCTNLKTLTINNPNAAVNSNAFLNTNGTPINSELTVYCYKNSSAEIAAQNGGYNIVYLGDSGGGSIPDTDASDFRFPAIVLFITAVSSCLAIGVVKHNMAK